MPARSADIPAEKLSKKEILSFQDQARKVEAEKSAKSRKRERKKREKELKKRREQQSKLVGPVFLVITVVISAVIYFVNKFI